LVCGVYTSWNFSEILENRRLVKVLSAVKEMELSWVWWHKTVMPALGRLRQVNQEFEDSLAYMVRPFLKTTKSKREQAETIAI
jgi:hypothetical protein